MGAEAAIPLRQPKPSALERIKAKATQAEPKSKKKEYPKVDGGPEVREHADNFREAQLIKKQAEGVMETHGDPLRVFIREVSDNEGFSGRFSNTWAVLGNKHTIKVSYANKFSINSQDTDKLAEICGEQYPHLFKEVMEVKLKPEVLEDNTLAERLMQILDNSDASWDDFFEPPALKVKVQDNFCQLVYQTLTPEQLAELRDYITQDKARLL